jgi:hypothetical protein
VRAPQPLCPLCPEAPAPVSSALLVQSTVHILRQIDVGDSVQLELAAECLKQRELSRGTTVLGASPDVAVPGVVLRREPLDLRLGPTEVSGHLAEVRARIFDFGVVAFRFTIVPRDAGAAALVDLGNRLARESATFDATARALWRVLARDLEDAVVPWEEDSARELLEDFTVFVLPEVPPGELAPEAAIAHLLLGEPRSKRLAASTVHEISRRTIRYYEDDLVVVDFDAAVVVDKDGAPDLVDIFEIASAQLLELRFYDGMLARALEVLLRDVRRARTAVWFFRSPFRELARRAAVLALELGEMTDRLERTITLVGDTYSTQVYRDAALRFRLAEASASVREKLGIIGRVSEALGHEIYARRDLVLEILVLVLIAVEVVVAFR